MQRTFKDYVADTLTVTAPDKSEYVGFRVKLAEANGDDNWIVDLNRDQVRDLIAQLQDWLRLQPVDPVANACGSCHSVACGGECLG